MTEKTDDGIFIMLTPEQEQELTAVFSRAGAGVLTQDVRALYISDFEHVGRQLRTIRLKKGISLIDLSRKVDVTYTFMSKVEHEKMKLTKTRQLMAWVKGLGFDEVYLKL